MIQPLPKKIAYWFSTTVIAILFLFSSRLSYSQSITFSEVNYHPDSTISSGSWIELFNYGTSNIDLTGWYLKDDNNTNSFVFPGGTAINAGERLVVVTDIDKFTERFPGVANYIGEIPFGFGNNGDQVRLFDNTFTLKVFMEYADSLPWPEAADGGGRTLELIDETQTPDDAGNWFAGCIGGSPGTAFIPCNDPLVFDEINYNSDTLLNSGDWLELYNRSSSGINLTGYSLKDSEDDNAYFFPANTQIAAGERLVVVHDVALFSARHPNVSNYVGPFIFNLSNGGELIRLFDSDGELTFSVVYDDEEGWPEGANGDGYTLELLDPLGNMNSGADWFDGCLEGSPGIAYDPDCSTGITDLQAAQTLQVFNNLSSGYITLNIPANLKHSEIFIYSTGGGLVEKITAPDAHFSFDVSHLPGGVYFVTLKNETNFLTGKFLVQ
ncbi:MAG: lamin tail domain-containing protein [Chitinophagales bacterium]